MEEGDQFRQLGGIPIVLNLLRSVISILAAPTICCCRKEGLSDVTNDKVSMCVYTMEGLYTMKALIYQCHTLRKYGLL